MRAGSWSCGLALGLVAMMGVAPGQRLAKPVVIQVIDPTGAPVPGASVHISPSGKDADRLVGTDQMGVAHLDVMPGRYDVKVMSPGFATQIDKFVDFPGVTATLTMKLSVAGSDSPIRVVETPLPEVPLVRSDDLLQAPTISPARPIPAGLAPGMKVKLVSEKGGEKVYAVIFSRGDEVLSGLTDFAIKYKVAAAHFTGIGAISGATVGWLDLSVKAYRPIEVAQQVEVLSMMGDIAMFNGKPVVHAHLVMGKQDGSTVGGHLWEAHVNPTLEVFVSVDSAPLNKKLDDASGMKLIDPTQ